MIRDRQIFPNDTFLGMISEASWVALSDVWTVHRVHARNTLITADDRNSRDVFFLLEGTVRATVYTESGREISMLNFTHGDIIGEFSAIDDAPRSADVVAETDCIVATLGQATFRRLLQENADISYCMLRLCVRHLRRLSKRVVDFNTKSADERLHETLLELARASANGSDEVLIERPPTQSELAAVIFASRESVAREMGRMRDAGILKRVRRALHIPSIEALENYTTGRSRQMPVASESRESAS